LNADGSVDMRLIHEMMSHMTESERMALDNTLKLIPLGEIEVKDFIDMNRLMDSDPQLAK
jgi:hypothetical protein